MLNLTKIKKTFGDHKVFDFHEWRLDEGIHWLKGGNGSGKSTLFRIIAGQLSFDGEVELNEVNLGKEPIKFRSQISFAEAEPRFPVFIKGQDIIYFYSQLRNSAPQEAEMLTNIFGMTDFLNSKIGNYSSGMLKKLSLICAFIGDADLYVLDEPLITLDSASADVLYSLIAERASQGKSFLLSSHQDFRNDILNFDGIFHIVDTQIVKL